MKKLLLLSLLALVGCKSEQRDVSEVKTIDIQETPDLINIEDIVDKDQIKMIKLETNPDCLIGSVSKIEIYEDKVFVMDKSLAEAVMLFDISGKFIKKITNKGQGPTEFLELSDFVIDAKNKELLVLDPPNKALTFYDLDGNFKRKDKIGFGSTHLCIMPSGNLAFYLREYYAEGAKDNPKKCKIFVTDRNYKVLDRFYDVTEGKMGMSVPERLSVINGDEVIFTPTYKSEIYSMDDDGLTLKYRLNFVGKTELPLEKLKSYSDSREMMNDMRDNNYSYYGGMFMQNEDYIAISTKCGIGEMTYTYYSLKTGKSISVPSLRQGVDNVRNLIFTPLVGKHNDYFVSTIDNFGFFEMMDIENSPLPQNIKQALSSYTSDDNPIIVLYKLKDF